MIMFFVRDMNNPYVLKHFSAMLKCKRIEKKLTQEQLAYKSGLSSNYIRRIEGCKVNPSLTTIQKIAKALEINISDLFQNL